MDVKNATIEELEIRKNEIISTIDGMEDLEELRALSTEMDSICNEMETRKAAENEKKEIRSRVANGEGKEIKKIEGEQTKMITRDSQEYKNAWLRAVSGKMTAEDEEIMREARAFSTSNTYAIPTTIAENVVECLKKVCPLIDEVDLYEVSGTIRVPYESVVSDAYDHTENAAITASSDALLYVDLAGTEVVKITEVSKNALNQSLPVFENWLVNQIARKLADKCDAIIVSGTYGLSSGTWTTDTNQIVDTNGLSYEALCSLVGLLPAALENGAKFAFNKKTLWKIKALVDDNGRPILDPNAKELLGFPYIIDDNIVTTADLVYFGNFKEAVKAKIENVEVEANDKGSGWDKALVSFRGYTIFDAKKVGSVGIVRFVTTA